ncbi:MAG: phosphatidate cytidylyltransferase [Phycisphaerales bacterium]
MLKYRLLLGPVLIAALIGGLWLDGWIDLQPIPAWLAWMGRFVGDGQTLPAGVVVFCVMVPISFLASVELVDILRHKGVASSRRITCAAALIGLCVSSLVPADVKAITSIGIVSTCAAGVLAMSLAYSSRRREFQGVIAAAGGTLIAFVYLGLMFGFVLAIRREHSAWVLLWILLVVKSFDIGAYFTGRAIGKHRLIPWLSPGKTWEGVVGGLVVSALAGAIGRWVLDERGLMGGTDDQGLGVSLLIGAGAGVLFGVFGQVGDLMASLLKRDAGVKDSGHSLPGFGGVLDVIDSPLLVAPIAFWWLAVVG